MKINKKILYFLFLFLLLLFIKVDFRIINQLQCCQDDFDYYSHALTIVQDFDFDYSNQFDSKKRFYDNGKIAPRGFVGSGLFSTPFLFIGNLADRFIENNQNILDYKKLFYSFSSIFYLFFSYFLIALTLKGKLSEKLLLFSYFGSGLSYFAFERYSMTHVYEVFTIALVIFFSEKYYSQKKRLNIFSILIPLSILSSFLVRWTNYYVVLIPFIIFKLSFHNKNVKQRLLKDKLFFVTSLISLGIFALMSKLIYGVVTFDPTYIYGAEKIREGVQNNIIQNLYNFLVDFFMDTLNTLFTFEFGLFWFSPIIFLGFLLTIFDFFNSKTNLKLVYFVILIAFAQCFAVISIWNSTGASYGFRYLYSLIPLCFYIISKSLSFEKYKVFKNYLLYFSIFSTFSILFFETTIGTQLSLEEVVNSFGELKRFSQPNYLIGYIEAIGVKESYLKIFATSMLGAFTFKIFIVIFDKDYLFTLLSNFGLSSNNEDFISLIDKLVLIEINKFVTVLIFCIAISIFYFKKISGHSKL